MEQPESVESVCEIQETLEYEDVKELDILTSYSRLLGFFMDSIKAQCNEKARMRQEALMYKEECETFLDEVAHWKGEQELVAEVKEFLKSESSCAEKVAEDLQECVDQLASTLSELSSTEFFVNCYVHDLWEYLRPKETEELEDCIYDDESDGGMCAEEFSPGDENEEGCACEEESSPGDENEEECSCEEEPSPGDENEEECACLLQESSSGEEADDNEGAS